jgi:hypothetical protein
VRKSLLGLEPPQQWLTDLAGCEELAHALIGEARADQVTALWRTFRESEGCAEVWWPHCEVKL